MSPWLLVFIVCTVSMGELCHVPIYKRGHYYGEKYTSVEHCVSVYIRTGFTIDEGTISVILTNRLFPDK